MKINAPYIEECPINLECKVMDIQKFASHDMFMAEVVCTHCDPNLLLENGEIDFVNANLISFAGKKYLAANQEIAVRGCGVK